MDPASFTEETSLNQSPSSPIDDVETKNVENDHPSSQPHSPDASEPRSPIDNQNNPLSPTSDAPESPDNDYQPDDPLKAPSASPREDSAMENAEVPEDDDQPTKADGVSDENPASPENDKSNSPMSPPASPASNQEEEPEITPKKKRRILDSDDESDGGSEKDAEAEVENKESDTESPTKKRRAIFGSDDEDSGDEEGDKAKSDGDDSPSSPKSDNEETAKDLVENIFGGSDDEKDDDKEPVDDDENPPKRGQKDDDGFEWDFDVMMRQKKSEKKQRKRKNDGFDLINDDDGYVARLVEAMKHAAKADRHSNLERRPALKKRKLLPTVKDQLLRIDMMEAMLEGGMMSALSEWLAPLPDKSLPCLEIRTSLLKLLQSYRLEQGTLRQSGIGKVIMMLFKHPKETKDNKILAQKLIGEWARPIFNLTTEYGSLTRDERIQRDYEQLPDSVKRRRESNDAGPSTSQDSEANPLVPGDKGFIGRARVPKVSKTDYVVRPKSNVEGEFKGMGKREMSRIDRAARDFKERTKKTKFGRAVGVSIEGRRMEI